MKFKSDELNDELTVFDPKKALYAPAGMFVVTDEKSIFEWVGSDAALSHVIVVARGENSEGQQVAVCGNFMKNNAPGSLTFMFRAADLIRDISVFLVSCQITEAQLFSLMLRDELGVLGVENPRLLMGGNDDKIAINVRTGEIAYDVAFAPANAGKPSYGECVSGAQRQLDRWLLYSTDASPSSCQRKLIELVVDGRNPRDVAKVTKLLSLPGFSHGNQYSSNPMTDLLFRMMEEMLRSNMSMNQAYNTITFLNRGLVNPQLCITYPERRLTANFPWNSGARAESEPEPSPSPHRPR